MQGFKPGAKPKDKGKGGKIQGPGTGTSDSIKAEIPKGSYIMPADSTKAIGEHALNKLGQPVPVNVSSGEYQMPPEQVHAVGAQVLDQMKGATHTPVAAMGFKPQEGELYFADGGAVESTDDLIARISAKYGTSSAPAPRAQPAPAPQQPAQRSAAPSIGSAADALRNRKRQIDAAAGFADGGLVDDERRRAPIVTTSGAPRQMPQGDPLRPSDLAQGFAAGGNAVTQRIAGGASAAARDFMAGGQAATEQIAGFGRTIASALTPQQEGSYSPEALGQPAPNPNSGSAWGAVKDALLYSSDAEAIRQRNAAPKGAPLAGASAPAEDQLNAGPAAAPSRSQYRFTPDPMQGPAPGMSTSQTSAPGITRIDGAPGLNSPLFTNLPAGQAVSEMQGGTVNTLPAAGFSAGGPAASRGVSAALQAAAARGDWDAVRGFYQRNGGTWQGRTAEQDAAESQGPKGGAIGSSRFGFNFARRSEDRAADRALTDRRARAEEGLSRDRLDIDRQRAEGEAQTREFEVRGMERVERLYQQLEKAQAPEERAAITEQLRALSGKEAPNRFTVVPGGQEFDPAANMVLNRPAMVLNNQTGQPVDLSGAQRQGAQQTAQRPVGTTSTVNGKTAVWDGSKWVPR